MNVNHGAIAMLTPLLRKAKLYSSQVSSLIRGSQRPGQNPEERLSIIVSTDSGLGNRIKALVSALRLTDQVYTTLPTYSYIFENYIPQVHSIPSGAVEFAGWRFVLQESDELEGWQALTCLPVGDGAFAVPEKRSIDLEYHRIPVKLKDSFLEAFHKLKIKKDIQETVSRFTADWGRDVIGVHVRTWTDDPLRQSLHDIRRFYEAIDRHYPDARIYLASDDKEVHAVFIERYGNKVISYPLPLVKGSVAHTAHTSNPEIVRETFIEMLCLSKANALVGTYLSTFSECAWWFSDCRQKVTII